MLALPGFAAGWTYNRRAKLIGCVCSCSCDRLPAQRMDDVPMVDNVCVLVMVRRAAAPQSSTIRTLARTFPGQSSC
jgi:hypothetical protein